MVLAIETNHLSKNYGQIRALDNVNLKVPKGSIYGYLGPNGAGKTTTMKILVGLLSYKKPGVVKIFDKNVDDNSTRILREIGFLPDGELPLNISVKRFLKHSARIHEISDHRRLKEVLSLLGIKKLENRKIGSLSMGQKQRVGIANSLLHDPQLLLLDEPNKGLDPLARIKTLALLKELAEEGKTIFISSHIIGEIDKISTDVAIINQGHIIEQGKKKELQKRFLKYGKYIIDGELDISKIFSFGYVESSEVDYLGRYIIHVNDIEIAEERLLSDLILKAQAKIRFFSSAESTLEEIFLDRINNN